MEGWGGTFLSPTSPPIITHTNLRWPNNSTTIHCSQQQRHDKWSLITEIIPQQQTVNNNDRDHFSASHDGTHLTAWRVDDLDNMNIGFEKEIQRVSLWFFFVGGLWRQYLQYGRASEAADSEATAAVGCSNQQVSSSIATC